MANSFDKAGKMKDATNMMKVDILAGLIQGGMVLPKDNGDNGL